MQFSKIEIKDIAKAWIAVSVMFAIAFAGIGLQLLAVVPIALLTAGIGFLLHELAHKWMAQRYGCWAEFRANNQMLVMGLLFSFFGFVLAAPGGVYFRGGGHHGKIALSGPFMNIILAIVFAALYFVTAGVAQTVMSYGWMINAWLAAFNLIPVMPFDGRAVIKWSKPVYFSVLAISLGLVFFSFAI